MKHTFTQLYSPENNDNDERFIQACLRECAHERIRASTAERTDLLPSFLSYYNARCPHSAIVDKSLASRLGVINLLPLDT